MWRSRRFSHPRCGTMDEKTPSGFRRKISGDVHRHHVNGGGSDTTKILGTASPFPEVEDESVDVQIQESGLKKVGDMSGHAGFSRGSGWITSATSAFSKSRTPNRQIRSGSVAQDRLENLRQEVANKPSYHKAFPRAKMRNDGIKGDLSTDVRYKFVGETKSDNQVKREKQQKWKQKMKIAQERKQLERKSLDESWSLERKSNQYGKTILSCVLDNVEQADLFKSFTRCGGPVDEDSILEASSVGSSTPTSEEESSTQSSKWQRSRRKEGSGSSMPRRHSESSGFSSLSVSVESGLREEMVPLSVEKHRVEKNNLLVNPRSTWLSTLKAQQESSPRSHGAPIPARNVSPNETELANVATTDTSTMGIPPSSTRTAHGVASSQHSASTMTTHPPYPSTERIFIKDFMEDISTVGETMLWHKETLVINPTTVTIYLRKGYRCGNGTFCAPRLVWTEEAKDHIYEVDLFDIQYLKKADALELENFPYAMPGRSVCLKITNGNSFILEARREEDAFRFVREIRQIVSRLSFNLVIGNLDVSCELLDMGLTEPASSHCSTLMEFDWSRAMDDISDHLVEKTLATTMI